MKRSVRDVIMIVFGILIGALSIFFSSSYINDPVRLLKNSTKLNLPYSIRAVSYYTGFIYFNGDGETLYTFDMDEDFLSNIVYSCPNGLSTCNLMNVPFIAIISRFDNRIEGPVCVEDVSDDRKGDRVKIYFSSKSVYLYLDRS